MAKKDSKMTFEEGLEKIDRIITTLESKGVGLDEAINYYDDAMKTIKECSTILDSLEAKVKKVVKANGGVVEEMVDLDEENS